MERSHNVVSYFIPYGFYLRKVEALPRPSSGSAAYG